MIPSGHMSSTSWLFPNNPKQDAIPKWHNLPFDHPTAVAARRAISLKSWAHRKVIDDFDRLWDVMKAYMWAQITPRPLPKKRRRRRMTLEQALAPSIQVQRRSRRATIARLARRMEPCGGYDEAEEPIETLLDDIAQTDLHSIPEELQRDPVDAGRPTGADRTFGADFSDVVHEEMDRRRK